MTNKLYFIATLLGAIILSAGIDALQCPSYEQVTFEKQIGVRPSNSYILKNGVFTYRPGDTPSTDWITIECVKRCKNLEGCHSVLVLYQALECIGLPRGDIKFLTVDNDASYFVKICMKVPDYCRLKLWTVESSPGYQILSRNEELQIFNNVTTQECSRLLTKSDRIRSSQFILPQNDRGFSFNGNDIEYDINAFGRCVLSFENKYTQPESFRVANNNIFYKENQCVEDFPKYIDRCSYEEYYNQTLKHYDVLVHGITTPECKRRCEDEFQFNCRGFTTIPYETRPYYNIQSPKEPDSDVKICLLHSEDTLSLGSWLLTKRVEAQYYRRVLCLNVSVECTPSSMTVTYWPRSDFRGRLYVNGYSESCTTTGQGRGQPTRLVIPFHGSTCGVNQAYAFSDGQQQQGENRTLMYAMLVIQNNPIIQAQGDRFVRAGCVAVPVLNVTLGTNIKVESDGEDNGVQGGSSSVPASSIINTTSTTRLPAVRMYIVNEPDIYEQMGQISGGAVALGETIELRIEAESSEPGLIDVHAYHLVASSQLGDSSVLLLDSRGCPTGQVDFPALRRTRSGGTVRLAARFKAFRFPNSHVVKFNVMVQFCVGPCGPVICDNQINSRNTRSANNKSEEKHFAYDSYENATVSFVDPLMMKEKSMKNANVIVASSDRGSRIKEMCREINEGSDDKIPLELSLIVASNDVFTADSLIYGENSRILVAGVDEPRTSHSMICIHEALFISITFIWLVVQILILAGCMLVIKRYRSFVEENRYQKDYHSFDNLGFDSALASRRVHWPDQSVDILHAS